VSAVLELTRELVRTETINPPGDESRAADLLGARLEAAGLDVECHPLAPGRDSLVARWAGRGTAPSLCLTAHLDTVPLGEAEWSRDPLAGELDGDRLYGRGASDMKGGLAAIVTAAAWLPSAAATPASNWCSARARRPPARGRAG
jgi:succinyl-diaminopimelate desuccinylase